MSGPMKRLLRLSKLMADGAEREVARNAAALHQATAAVRTAETHAQELRRQLAAQRDQTRELFLGATHARTAIEMLMSDLTGLDKAEERADADVVAAEAARVEALGALKAAQADLQAAQNKVARRALIVRQQEHRAVVTAELAAETDAMDQWTAAQPGWRPA